MTRCNTLPLGHDALQHTAILLQHTAAQCSTLQHNAAHCSTMQHTAAQCSTLQHNALHCNTLQHTTAPTTHTATLCSTLQQTLTFCSACLLLEQETFFARCNFFLLFFSEFRTSLEYEFEVVFLCARCCLALRLLLFVLQCVTPVLQCVAVCYSVLQCVAVCCSVLQCVAVCYSLLTERVCVLQ